MIPRPIDQIADADLQALVANGVAESRDIEYKAILKVGNDADKREFLADVCSFANATGGDLVFGVLEDEGIPTAVEGFHIPNLDNARLQIEGLIRDGIRPRIAGIQFKTVDGYKSGSVLIIRIPRSWTGPHMVTFQNSSKFFARGVGGKYQLDVDQIRQAILGHSAVSERIRNFRADRLSLVLSGETGVYAWYGGIFMLHLVPFDAFEEKEDVGAGTLLAKRQFFPPIDGANDYRVNEHGIYSFHTDKEGGSHSYCQVFRNRSVETVWEPFSIENNGGMGIASEAFEEWTIKSFKRYQQGMGEIGVNVPISVCGVLVGVKGVHMIVSPRIRGRTDAQISHDMVQLPSVVMESLREPAHNVLRPIFDAVWNACGYEKSMNYDIDGNWKPH